MALQYRKTASSQQSKASPHASVTSTFNIGYLWNYHVTDIELRRDIK